MKTKSSLGLIGIGITIWLVAVIFSFYEKEWSTVIIATLFLSISAVWKNKKNKPRNFL